jgi:hypothetical protein
VTIDNEGVSLLNTSKLILVKKANSIKIPIKHNISFLFIFIYLLSIQAAAVAVPLSTSVKPLSLCI